MLMKLLITKDDGTPLHEVRSSILNGIFSVVFDQGFIPTDETGMLRGLEISCFFTPEEEYINAEFTTIEGEENVELPPDLEASLDALMNNVASQAAEQEDSEWMKDDEDDGGTAEPV